MSRIFVVDDDPMILKYCETVLTAAEHEVIICSQPNRALQMILTHKADLLVVDIVMPGVNGFDLVKKIRDNPELAEIPILMFSARNTQKDVMTAMHLGATDYMIKPFNKDIFLNKVRTLLGNSEYSVPEIRFLHGTPRAQATIEVPVYIYGITEMGLTLRTWSYLDRGTDIVVQSSIFDEIGILSPPLKVVWCRPIDDAEHKYKYEVFISFIGLDEESMWKIRSWIEDRKLAARKAA